MGWKWRWRVVRVGVVDWKKVWRVDVRVVLLRIGLVVRKKGKVRSRPAIRGPIAARVLDDGVC